jgi:hypothetical protein
VSSGLVLDEIERVRTRIASDLHDEIGAGLSEIAILSEVVNQRLAVPALPAPAMPAPATPAPAAQRRPRLPCNR